MATTFDFYIHPSHGIGNNGTFTGFAQEESSAAEKLLAALAATQDAIVDEDDDATVCDLVMDDSEGGDLSDFSSLDTPSSSFTNLQQIKDDPTFSFFPNVEASAPSTTGLQRISSCSFVPDTGLLNSSLAPIDEALQAQILATQEDRASTPTSGGFSMIPLASTSSGMMRSFSAPAHSIAEYKAIMERWNEESAEASTSALPDSELPDSPRRHYMVGRPNMQRRATSGGWTNTSRKGKMPLRRASATTEDRSVDVYLDADDEDGTPAVQDTFSSRSHLLSPTKKHSPFKRSRLSYAPTQHATVYEDPRESEFASIRPTTPRSGDQALAPSPPKSPSRPALNRHFTSPEFWSGGDVQNDSVF